jgi:hypothetical protein
MGRFSFFKNHHMDITNNDFYVAIKQGYLWSLTLSADRISSQTAQPLTKSKLRINFSKPQAGNTPRGGHSVEVGCSLHVVNCTDDAPIPSDRKRIARINFFCLLVMGGHLIKSFLNRITPTCDVSFKIVAFKAVGGGPQANLVTHKLYGYIDGQSNLLHTHVGPEDHTSPIQCQLEPSMASQ